MALNIDKLGVLAYANGFTLWHYNTALDDRAALLAANHFLRAGALLRRDDVILACGQDGYVLLHVTAASPGTVSVAAIG